MSYFYLLSGRVQPVFLVDEDGEPALFNSEKEARAAALRNPMCMSIGYIIIEMDDNGPVGEAI